MLPRSEWVDLEAVRQHDFDLWCKTLQGAHSAECNLQQQRPTHLSSFEVFTWLRRRVKSL